MTVTRLLPIALVGLAACKDDPSPPDTTDPVTTPEPLLLDVATPVLPSQLLIDLDRDLDELAALEVLHEGPSGATSSLEAVYTAAGDRIGWEAPDGRWAVGSHTVRVDPDVALWGSADGGVEALSFEITETWAGDGRDHEAWTIDTLVIPPSGTGPLVLELAGELVVVPPEEPDGDWVLLTTLEDCVVYRGPVAVVPDGYELSLATMEVDIGAEGPLVLDETQLAFSFASDGSEGVGQFHTVADGRQTTDLDDDGGLGPAFVCDTVASFVSPCHRCDPDDAEAFCFDVFVPWVGMVPRVEPLPFDPLALPICGVDVSGAEAPDLEITIPPIDCSLDLDLDPDLDCGCQSVPGRLGLAFAPVGVGRTEIWDAPSATCRGCRG